MMDGPAAIDESASRRASAKRSSTLKSSTCVALVVIALTTGATTGASAQTPGPMRLAVTLKLHNTSDLDKLIAAQTDPRSPRYAHFLTPATFQATYAPTESEYDATVAALRASGFVVVRTMRDRSLVDVSASTATIAKTFGSAPHAGWTPEIDPTTLPYVGSISAGESIATPQTISLSTPSIGRYLGNDGAYAPAAIETAYDFPILHGYDGAGMTVADVVAGTPYAGLASLIGYYGIMPVPRAPNIIDINGAIPHETSQADFDGFWILGTAPGATLAVYNIPSLTNVNIVDALDRVVSDDLADVINVSFEGCEPNPTLTEALIPVFTRASALGMTIEAPVFGGVNVCGFANLEVAQTPADITDVLAVGGSNAITSPKYTLVAESALPNSGGGVSIVIPLPAEQKPIPGMNPAGRNVPDFVIAGEIDGEGPTLSYNGFGPAPIVNNPAAGGMLAEIAQFSGHRLGAFARTMYRAFSAFGYGSAFKDITRGCNGVINATNVCAIPGYDVTSGIGSIDATSLANLIQPATMMKGAER